MKPLSHASNVQGADLQQVLQIRQHMASDQLQMARIAERSLTQSSISPVSGSGGASSTGQNLNTRA